MILQTINKYKNYENEEMEDEIQDAEIQMEMQDETFVPAFSIEVKSESNKLYKLEWNDTYKDAMNLFYGTVLIEKDVEKAIEIMKIEAENQNVLALFALGNIYQRGIGVEADELVADEYYASAFEGFNLFYDVSISEKEKNYLSYYIGKSYLYGLGVEKDDSKAVMYLNNCQGNKYAEYLLYKAYTNIESEQAIVSLMKSAEYGYDLAQFLLGKKLLEGTEIEKNVHDAVKWLSESASNDNMFAQYQLGKLFLFGRDVPKDEELAIQYLQASASHGDEYAQWLLDHKDDYQTQPMMLIASRLFHHMSKMFENQMMSDKSNPLRNVDRKLRRKIQEKRAALGHKEDDHSMNFEN